MVGSCSINETSTYPPANRCSSVSFCAIFFSFFFLSQIATILALYFCRNRVWLEKAGQSAGFMIPEWRAPPLFCVSAGSVKLSAVDRAAGRPEELLAFASVGRAGALPVTWRHVLATLCLVLFRFVAQSTKVQKQLENNTLNLWVSSHLYWFQCRITVFLFFF